MTQIEQQAEAYVKSQIHKNQRDGDVFDLMVAAFIAGSKATQSAGFGLMPESDYRKRQVKKILLLFKPQIL